MDWSLVKLFNIYIEQLNNSQRSKILIKNSSIKLLKIEYNMNKFSNKPKIIWHGMKLEEMKLLEKLKLYKTINALAINFLLNQLNITQKH